MIAAKLTSSVIVAQALGLQPEGAKAKEAHTCALCGLGIEPGDLHAPFSVSQAFTDDIFLAQRGSKAICGHCAVLLPKDVLRATGYGVFSPDGARPFRKWKEIREALLNPPHGPFVMVRATANQQHMAWRAPVNFSRDLFHVRVGLRDLSIRREVLTKAVDWCETVGVISGPKTLPNPFNVLDPDLKDIDHGRISTKLVGVGRMAELKDQEREVIQLLRQLSLGESWALRFILSPDAGA